MTSTPEQLLDSLKKRDSRRGQGELKIYLGMVAGVGKTFAMLKAAHQLHQQKCDVVVGYVETHKRLETEALVQGLEVIPRIKLQHKEVWVEEMDLDAILKRRPHTVLVDELAHTNAPGSRHPKRYQDVLEILTMGINVLTTLNVQHIQSRADTVSQLTSVSIHEIVPDSILDRADEVVLIDLNPDEILDRLKLGKIYALDKANLASQNFFRPANLTALREISLRLMTERVDHELTELKHLHGISLDGRPNRKLLVAIFASPYSEYLIRWTRRLSYAMNSKWAAVYVRTNQVLSDEEEKLLRKNIEMVKDLDGEVIIEEHSDVAEGILSAAKKVDATQLVIGKPKRNYFWWFWRRNFSDQFIYKQKEIDVYVVSPPGTKESHRIKFSNKSKKIFTPTIYDLANSALVVLATTLFNLLLFELVPYRALGMFYMLVFCLAAIFLKNFSVMFAALLSGIVWNLVFIPPRFTFHISHPEDGLLIVLFIATSTVIGVFTRRLKDREDRIRLQAQRTDSLYRLTQSLASAKDAAETIQRALEQIQSQINKTASVWSVAKKNKNELMTRQGPFIPTEKEQGILDWIMINRKPAGKFTDTLPSSQGYYRPLVDQTGCWGVLGIDMSSEVELSSEILALIETIALQLSFALGRDELFQQLSQRQVMVESERLYKTLLNSVSHEFRTPLSAIVGFASELSSKNNYDQTQTQEISKEILSNAKRLDGLVQNLLDMSRVESGHLQLQIQSIDIEETVQSAIKKVASLSGHRRFTFDFPSQPVLVHADFFLIEQTLENIYRNACLYTPEGSGIETQVIDGINFVKIVITDDGPGLGHKPEKIFQKFYRANPTKTGGTGLGLSIARAVIELHGGNLTAENAPHGGASFQLTLPKER